MQILQQTLTQASGLAGGFDLMHATQKKTSKQLLSESLLVFFMVNVKSNGIQK